MLGSLFFPSLSPCAPCVSDRAPGSQGSLLDLILGIELKAGEFITRAGNRGFQLPEAVPCLPSTPRNAVAGAVLPPWTGPCCHRGRCLPCLPGVSSRHPATWSCCRQGATRPKRGDWEATSVSPPSQSKILDDQRAEGGLLGPRSQIPGPIWYFLKE